MAYKQRELCQREQKGASKQATAVLINIRFAFTNIKISFIASDGKETTVPFPWFLAVHHQALAFRARLDHARNETPQGEADREGLLFGGGGGYKGRGLLPAVNGKPVE